LLSVNVFKNRLMLFPSAFNNAKISIKYANIAYIASLKSSVFLLIIKSLNSMKKKMLVSLCLLAGLAPVLSSCATIIDGTKQKVSFSSNPSNAEVIVDGRMLGRTPLTEDLSKKDIHTVKINLNGYHPYEMTLIKKVNSWVWGNIVLGGLIGLGVDAITGGLYELSPTQVNADLKVKGLSSASMVNKALYVTVTLHPDSSWKKIGNLESL